MLSQSAAEHFKNGLKEIVATRRMGTWASVHSQYMKNRIKAFQKEKALYLPKPNQIDGESNKEIEQVMSDQLNRLHSECMKEFKILKRKGHEIILAIQKKMSRIPYLMMYDCFHAACAFGYSALGKHVCISHIYTFLRAHQHKQATNRN